MTRDATRETEVLIIGADPTGLALTLWLTRLGVRVRIVDKTREPGTTSRALVVHARTLEHYRQIGLADAMVEQALKFAAVNLWVAGERVGRAAFGNIGAGLSPFPYMLIFPQDQQERLLIDQLSKAGVVVGRSTELLGFDAKGERVAAHLKRSDGTDEICAAAYLAGCDGTHSRVREELNIGFPGGTYDHLFYVADVAASGAVINAELHVALDEADLLGVFPMKGGERARLIGTVRESAEDQQKALAWDDVSKHILERMRINIERVNWFSTYRVHHRVAEYFRSGRVFLVGDAAHIHSPVGGQGMNTGIGDAVNLAWKLAAVLQGQAQPQLLDSYEPERIAFARRLVATTDRVFTLVTRRGPIARMARLHVVPYLVPMLFNFEAVRRFMFLTVSQTVVNYRASALSAGNAGRIHGGDRLPWVKAADSAASHGDNFSSLTTMDWQVHVYGELAPKLLEVCAKLGLMLHVFPWRQETDRAGLMRNAVYLVRPDGYVALADPDGSVAKLESYLNERGVRLAAARSSTPFTTH